MQRRLPSWLLALALLGTGCSFFGDKKASDDDSASDDDDSAGEEPAKATPVKVAAVTRGSIAQSIASSATVDTDRRADIVVEVSGTVESIAVEEGDRVGVDAVLAELRNPQLKGELERAQVAFDQAEQEYGALQELVQKGFVARKDAEQARSALDQARATLDQARAGHSSRLLTSPIAGTVSMRDLRFGEAVSPPKLAFQVVDLRALKVELNLPEKDLARLHVGQTAQLRSEVLDKVQEVSGRLQRISPVVDPATGTVKCTVAIDPEQSALRPGMFVNVELIVDTHADALLLSKRAVVYDEGEPLVFVVEGDIARRTPIEIGFTDRDEVEVLSGVADAAQVVVVGQGLLRDGAEVRVVPDQPAPAAAEATPPGAATGG